MKVEILPMTYQDLDEVCLIEKKTFPSPWSKKIFESELAKGDLAIYLVAKISGKVVGYTGLFRVLDEGHIANLAVERGYRRQGIGSSLIFSLIKRAIRSGIKYLTLEVRESNQPAQELYEKFGFHKEGVRINYYSDTGEDAIVMWTDNITSLKHKNYLGEIELYLKEKRLDFEEGA